MLPESEEHKKSNFVRELIHDYQEKKYRRLYDWIQRDKDWFQVPIFRLNYSNNNRSVSFEHYPLINIGCGGVRFIFSMSNYYIVRTCVFKHDTLSIIVSISL
jgi:hypothetical protein